jgi:hypothetical protein
MFCSVLLSLLVLVLQRDIGSVLDTTSRTPEDECKWFYYQMIYSPETNDTIKHDSCYGY